MSNPNRIEVPPTGFLFAPVWWRLLGLGLELSLVGAIGPLVFVPLVALGTDLVWGKDAMSVDLFSGTLILLVISQRSLP